MRTLVVLSVMLIAMFVQTSFSSEALPEPGGPCTEPDALYNYASNVVKTPWALHELYAVPAGTLDPAAWESSPDFAMQFAAQLGSGTTPTDYAQACVAVWGSFFTANAAVLFNVDRQITTTQMELKCVSGTWTVQSTETNQVHDITDWLAAASGPFSVNDSNARLQLQGDLENTLADLNSQPGAN